MLPPKNRPDRSRAGSLSDAGEGYDGDADDDSAAHDGGDAGGAGTGTDSLDGGDADGEGTGTDSPDDAGKDAHAGDGDTDGI